MLSWKAHRDYHLTAKILNKFQIWNYMKFKFETCSEFLLSVQIHQTHHWVEAWLLGQPSPTKKYFSSLLMMQIILFSFNYPGSTSTYIKDFFLRFLAVVPNSVNTPLLSGSLLTSPAWPQRNISAGSVYLTPAFIIIIRWNHSEESKPCCCAWRLEEQSSEHAVMQ